MTDERGHRPHSDSTRVEAIREGEAVVLFTPCHGARVFLDVDEAVPGAVVQMVCPREGRRWMVELVADSIADSGLQPIWTDPEGEL